MPGKKGTKQNPEWIRKRTEGFKNWRRSQGLPVSDDLGEAPLCACGCGEKVKKHSEQAKYYTYMNGHNRCGKKNTKEHNEKISKANKGIFRVPRDKFEIGLKIRSEKMKGIKRTKEEKKIISETLKRKYREDKEYIKLMEKARSKTFLKIREFWNSEEGKKKREEINKKIKERYLDPSFKLKQIMALPQRSPNKSEKLLDEMTPEDVRFVGDGSWWRLLKNGKYKNPDFKVTGQNKVIELFGEHVHTEEEAKELIYQYKLIGLKCLIIWHYEMNRKYKLLKSVERINRFVKEK